MGDIKVGDVVARKSYGYDVFFKVVDIQKEGEDCIVTLKGIAQRLDADAPESDLTVQDEDKVVEYRSKCCCIQDKHSKFLKKPYSKVKSWRKKENIKNL
jgi:spore coat assembly protein